MVPSLPRCRIPSPSRVARGLRAAITLCLPATLAVTAGCSLLSPKPPAPLPVAVAAPAPPPAPVLPLPVDTHKFNLSGPDQDVVGTVQVTVARQSDTLLDIARRFNVGYEEIVHA